MRVASLISEWTELQERVQHMTEEVERLKSDLKNTMSARARAESREDEVRNSLTGLKASFGRFGVSCGLRRMTWLRPGMGCSLPSMSFRWLGISSLHPGVSRGNLKRSSMRPMANCAIR